MVNALAQRECGRGRHCSGGETFFGQSKVARLLCFGGGKGCGLGGQEAERQDTASLATPPVPYSSCALLPSSWHLPAMSLLRNYHWVNQDQDQITHPSAFRGHLKFNYNSTSQILFSSLSLSPSFSPCGPQVTESVEVKPADKVESVPLDTHVRLLLP